MVGRERDSVSASLYSVRRMGRSAAAVLRHSNLLWMPASTAAVESEGDMKEMKSDEQITEEIHLAAADIRRKRRAKDATIHGLWGGIFCGVLFNWVVGIPFGWMSAGVLVGSLTVCGIFLYVWLFPWFDRWLERRFERRHDD